jgi:hypothetical protein
MPLEWEEGRGKLVLSVFLHASLGGSSVPLEFSSKPAALYLAIVMDPAPPGLRRPVLFFDLSRSHSHIDRAVKYTTYATQERAFRAERRWLSSW